MATGKPDLASSVDDLPQRLIQAYPALAELPRGELGEALRTEAQVVRVPAGTPLFAEGQTCPGFPLVLAGEVRVARGSPAGRQIELYRVGPGDLCVVSASCLFGAATLTAHGDTTEPTTLVVLSPTAFDRLTRHEPFRRFVFAVFGERLADLMALAEAVAFQRLDQRLAATLLGHGAVLATTHQALADELGTVREIVTRLLKRFEQAGWIRIGRERIEILDAAALRSIGA
jgi:CRP/FNR family transcriptional regulator, anaerobic regulatory protein